MIAALSMIALLSVVLAWLKPSVLSYAAAGLTNAMAAVAVLSQIPN